MKHTVTVLTVLALVLMTVGCATFQSKQKVNLAPFAENAVSIVAEVEYGLSQARAIHVREFIDGPAVKEYEAQWKRVGKILRGIVAYSIAVVTISESNLTDKEKANALADYLTGIAEPVRANQWERFKITESELKATLDRIRKQENYFAAMNAAQPIIDEVARVARLAIEDVKTAQDAARIEVAGRIEAEHAPVLSFRESIKEGQTRTFRSLNYAIRINKGEEGMIDSLFAYDPQLKSYLKPGGKVDQEVVDNIEQRFIWRLQTVKLIQDQIYPELERYEEEMRELDDLIMIADRGIKQSKGAIIVWRRAHQTMAAGITEPAAIDLFGVAQSAVRKVVPLP
jgi:ribosomal protein S8